jgi:hypothetical protein
VRLSELVVSAGISIVVRSSQTYLRRVFEYYRKARGGFDSLVTRLDQRLRRWWRSIELTKRRLSLSVTILA